MDPQDLIDFLTADNSVFVTVADVIEDVPNTHAAYERLLEGVVAIGVLGGFPQATFRAMVIAKFDQIWQAMA